MCAIGMVKLPFFINLKFSRAVECKNILKLPRPTLFWTGNHDRESDKILGQGVGTRDRTGYLNKKQRWEPGPEHGIGDGDRDR